MDLDQQEDLNFSHLVLDRHLSQLACPLGFFLRQLKDQQQVLVDVLEVLVSNH